MKGSTGMCESAYYDDYRVKTLYGVVHEVMLAGKTYHEMVSDAQEWVRQHGRHYIRTCVEEKDGHLFVVVRTCADISEIGTKECVVANDVPVPESFFMQARARLQQQLA